MTNPQHGDLKSFKMQIRRSAIYTKLDKSQKQAKARAMTTDRRYRPDRPSAFSGPWALNPENLDRKRKPLRLLLVAAVAVKGLVVVGFALLNIEISHPECCVATRPLGRSGRHFFRLRQRLHWDPR